MIDVAVMLQNPFRADWFAPGAQVPPPRQSVTLKKVSTFEKADSSFWTSRPATHGILPFIPTWEG